MHPTWYKVADHDEEEKHRAWVRANYTIGEKVKDIWHPVVKHECATMNLEAWDKAKYSFEVVSTKEA